VKATLKVGVCSWTDRTLLESGWYPAWATTAEARLRYYASQFSLVENDGTYYALPSEKQARLWVERTPEGFTMNVKAFALLTTHFTNPLRLPRDLRQALSAQIQEKSRIYPRDLDPEVVDEIWRRFRSALEPLRVAGKLGAVLFQMPPWFSISRDNKRYLETIRERLPDLPLAVEFRHHLWMEPRNQKETLELLRRMDLAYVCVDEPQGTPWSIPPVAEVTSSLAMVRLHGRNAETWQKPQGTAAERFKYLYSREELAEWVPRVQRLASTASVVHVLMNNCYRDYAVRNARQMEEMLRELP
jgi:uncharacterized protein YecE (DUF72 family)